jgi:hypothetical protein
MEFRLIFKGHLPPEDKADVKVKHDIRQQLHPQLREVWRSHPNMRNSMKPKGATGLSEMDEVAKNNTRFGFRFVPLIREVDNACSLNIVILFRHEPYRAWNHGDLDNRIKTLVDGMRMPKQGTELPKGSPSPDEDPFFVLMDDDKVIYEFQVTSDQLFLPFERNKEYGEKYRDVVALIGIRLTTLGRNPITYLS